jgi:hypothetical protein
VSRPDFVNDPNTARRQMIEIMRRELPAEIIGHLEDLVADLASRLGESPEAWRGAVATSGLFGLVLAIEDTPTSASLLQAALVALIADHPAAASLFAGRPR